VSLWIDLGRRVVVALCTNRTALGRGETRIRDFRPRFHDAVLRALGLAG
jgi:serine-type D-Ala-D-Ala carboxypeptidase